MGLFKSGIKLGTALGLTYLSVEQRLWSQLSEKEIASKLSAFKNYNRKAVTFVTQKTGLEISVKQWLPTQQSLNTKSITAKNMWNRSVKTTFRTLSELNLKDLMTKIQKLMNTTK